MNYTHIVLILIISLMAACIFSCFKPPQKTDLSSLNKYEKADYTKKVQIAEAYVQKTVSAREIDKMINRMDGVFEDWAKTRVPRAMYYEGYTISRNMFFNKEKTKALTLVQRNYPKRNKGVVQLITCEKIDGLWYFDDRGKVSYSFSFKGERAENQPTLKELEFTAINNLAEDGLVKGGKVSQKYINNYWF